MSNLSNKLHLVDFKFDKNSINEKTLVEILKIDADFTDTAEEISREIYENHSHIEEETDCVIAMITSLFDVPNFIGNSSAYGDFKCKVIDTEFEWIVCIAYIV